MSYKQLAKKNIVLKIGQCIIIMKTYNTQKE